MGTTLVHVSVEADGSIKLPPAIQEALGVRAGDEVTVRLDEGRHLAIGPKRRDLLDIAGTLAHYARPDGPLTVEEIDASISAAVVESYERSTR